MRAAILLVGAAIALASCATEVTTIYSCAGAPTIAATYSGDTAQLRFGNGERLQLPLIPSETGQRYTDGRVSWLASGRDALLMRNGNTTRCDAL